MAIRLSIFSDGNKSSCRKLIKLDIFVAHVFPSNGVNPWGANAETHLLPPGPGPPIDLARSSSSPQERRTEWEVLAEKRLMMYTMHIFF